MSIDLSDPALAAYIKSAREGRATSLLTVSDAERRRRDAAYSRTYYWKRRRPSDAEFYGTLI